MTLPENVDIVEPFVGQGDLIKWINEKLKYKKIETYDLDPKINCDNIRDTISNPPNYFGKYVVTNPPYLAKNKNKDKSIYLKYGVDDLYKAFLKTLIQTDCQGGIIIIPLNFFSGEDDVVRKEFLTKYKVYRVNVFEEQVFNDTSYTICAFSFEKNLIEKIQNIDFHIFPNQKVMNFFLSEEYGFRIGGDILNCKNKLKLGRLLKGQNPSTNMTLYAVDSGTMEGRIRLVVKDEHYYGKNTDRVFCTITSPNSIKDQEKICKKFNEKLEQLRNQYNSLFLTNYRESTKSYSRKRISFKQAFCLLNQIILYETD